VPSVPISSISAKRIPKTNLSPRPPTRLSPMMEPEFEEEEEDEDEEDEEDEEDDEEGD
jgi:hypothetical protein